MELLEKLPISIVQWLLQEYLPDDDDSDYTPEQLLEYDPRGAFEDNLNDMTKEDAIDSLSTLIERLLPEFYTRPGLGGGKMQYMKPCNYTDHGFERRTLNLKERALEYEEIQETRGLNGSYDEYIDEHSDADPGL